MRCIFLATGGTGGHLYPALAIADVLKERFPGVRLFFVGTSRGIEARVVPQKGYPLLKIPARGLPRGISFKTLGFLGALGAGLLKSLYLIRRHRPDLVLGGGAYVSAPMVLAAFLLRVPRVIQEQNSYPGLATRLLARVADRIYLSFEESRSYFSRRQQPKIEVVGNPVRGDLRSASRERALKAFGLDARKKTLLIFGGSQGARTINRVCLEILESLMERSDIQIIWGTGGRDYGLVRGHLEGYGRRIFVADFLEDMPAAYAASDLAICRAGATTVAELLCCGLPAVLIPFPYAAAGHQEANARLLAERGAALFLPERELSGQKLLAWVLELLDDPSQREHMRRQALALARCDAAQRIVDDLCSFQRGEAS